MLLLTTLAALLGFSFLIDSSSDDEDTSETVSGTDDADLITTGSGDDTIFANGGDDVVSGGAGDDRIFLGDGDDVSLGIDEDVVATWFEDGRVPSEAEITDSFDLSSEEGDDFIRGGDGNDVIADASGSDIIYGGLGADFVSTLDRDTEDEETDTVYGGYGADLLIVDDGDTVSGGQGTDEIFALRTTVDDEDFITVTDFDPEEDLLELGWSGEELYSDDVTLSETAAGVMVAYAGIDMALLEGLTLDQIPDDMDIAIYSLS